MRGVGGAKGGGRRRLLRDEVKHHDRRVPSPVMTPGRRAPRRVYQNSASRRAPARRATAGLLADDAPIIEESGAPAGHGARLRHAAELSWTPLAIKVVTVVDGPHATQDERRPRRRLPRPRRCCLGPDYVTGKSVAGSGPPYERSTLHTANVGAGLPFFVVGGHPCVSCSSKRRVPRSTAAALFEGRPK